MKQAWHIVFSIALLIAFSACQKEGAGCFESRGAESSERREIDSFDDLYVDGRVNVILVQDTQNFALVQFGDNGLAGIETRIENNTLHIDEINTCDWMRKVDPLPEVELHYKSMDNLYTKSAAVVRFQNEFVTDIFNVEINDAAGSLKLKLKCDELSIIAHTGATDVAAEGSADKMYIYNSSYAPIHAESFETRIATVHNNSSGDTYVSATERLNTTITEDGNIYLYGGGTIKGNQDGSGQVFIMED